MSGGCQPWPPVTFDVEHTIINVGGGAEWYRNGTGPNPFEFRTATSNDTSVTITQSTNEIDFQVSLNNVGNQIEVYIDGTFFNLRTLQSSDNSITITQNALDIDFEVDFAGNVSLANVGGFAEVYRNGTGPNPFELRTLQSSDGSVTITQNTNDIDFVVPPSGLHKAFQVDSVATGQTGGTTYITIDTLAGDAKVLDGETWKINVCCFICHPPGLTTVNTFVRWQVETSAGVFTTFDEWQANWPISINPGENSTPAHRTKFLTASMDSPRMRCQLRMSAFVAQGTLLEAPRWGGVIIDPAE